MRSTIACAYMCATLLLLAAGGCEISKQTVGTPNTGNPSDTTDITDSTGVTVTVSVTPADALVMIGETRQFSATVSGSANTAVAWSVESGAGTISAAGLYTAPASITGDTLAVVVKAVSSADARAIARANIRVAKPLPADTNVCFQRDVMPIFTGSCALSGCHDALTATDGKDFSSYEGIRDEVRPGRPQNSEIYHVITEDDNDDRMPPPPMNRLTSGQIETIRKWIEQGAQNTTCSTGTSGCDTVNVTFTAAVRPVLQNNCVACHSGAFPSGGIILSTYAGVKAVADNGKLVGAIAHQSGFIPMPQGGARLPDCQISQIRAWVNKGAPNN